MIRHHLFPVSALLVAAFAASASAQQPAGRPAAQPTPTPTATAPTASATAVQLPTSKMDVIYTDLFLDQKTGIAKFNSVVTKLNTEFQKTKDELTQMQTRGTTLEAEINKLREAPASAPVDQRSLQAKIDQLD